MKKEEALYIPAGWNKIPEIRKKSSITHTLNFKSVFILIHHSLCYALIGLLPDLLLFECSLRYLFWNSENKLQIINDFGL